MYMLTLALAAFLPGPGMTGLMFKTLSQGHKNGVIMLFGLITGDTIFLLISMFFMKAIVQLNHNASFYLIVLSCLYLGYLSYKFWNFDQNLIGVSYGENKKSFFLSYKDGLLITLSNPKTISFYFALVPTIFGTQNLQKLSQWIVFLTILTLILVGGCYIGFSLKLKMILKSMKIQKILLKSLSIFMFFLAFIMLYSELNI